MLALRGLVSGAAAARSSRLTCLAAVGNRYKHSLPDLPYDYNALEPVISAEIMQLHHSKHHATYVNNLNLAEEKLVDAVEKNDVSSVIGLQGALKFNGGGHLNHSIFWQNLCPGGSGEPSGDLEAAIVRDFGSVQAMKDKLSASTVAVQGSGWGWLGFNAAANKLEIATCANQDPLKATTGLVPLFGIDVWEHAYYLQYKNVRPDYVKAIFQIANWNDVAARYAAAGEKMEENVEDDDSKETVDEESGVPKDGVKKEAIVLRIKKEDLGETREEEDEDDEDEEDDYEHEAVEKRKRKMPGKRHIFERRKGDMSS